MTRKVDEGAAAEDRPRRPPLARVLPPSFYAAEAEEVARRLLGARVVSLVGGERCAGEIVETEAYVGPHDDASHGAARVGRTSRNAAMFGAAGRAYVYRIYGIHWCLNAVSGAEGYPAAVLIRALRPVEGLEAIRARRPGRPDRDLLRGPGNLARGLGIDGALNEHPLDDPPLWIERGAAVEEGVIAAGPRVGISRAVDWPLRFWVRGSRWVSGRS